MTNPDHSIVRIEKSPESVNTKSHPLPPNSMVTSPSLPSIFVTSKTFRHFKNHLEPAHCFHKIPPKGNIVLGLNVDSEFQIQSDQDIFNPQLKAQSRQIVTLQVSDLLNRHPQILVHPDTLHYAQSRHIEHLIRHPCAQSEFIAADYLNSLGIHTNLIYDDRALSAKRTMTVLLCGFFMVVDLYPYFQGRCQAYVEELIVRKKVIHQRHLKFVPDPGKDGQKKLRLPYYIEIQGQRFGLIVDFLDPVGAQGKINFKTFCQNVGLIMDAKDSVGENISRMMEFYFENPQIYDDYAQGDLIIYPAWKLFSQNIQELSAKMIAPDYAVDPSLTIGSTTNKILDGKRLHYLSLSPSQNRSSLYYRFLGEDTFLSLDNEQNPAHTQLKVDGGRCHCNHSSLAKVSGALCDLDLKGAYTSAMMHLPYFLGTPTVASWEEPLSLKKVLKKFKKQLLTHHWTMRVSTTKPLTHPQDLIPSYYDYKWKERKTDTENYEESGELDYDSGKAKIFARDIINGMITSDLLDIVLNTWTAEARQEFLTEIKVHSLIFYDPALEIKDATQFSLHVFNADIDQKKPTHWHAILLKDLGIEAFKEERKKHPKQSPMNVLYKLLSNTAYGAIVSHFFMAQNPITANNITAHIRAAVYLTEKSLGLYQTITDGGLFNLNEVLTPKRKGKIYTDRLYDILSTSKRDLDRKLDLKRSGLGGFAWHMVAHPDSTLSLYKDHELLTRSEAESLVNRLCLEHLQKTFPNVAVLTNPHLEFELKNFFTQATLHGSSNYGFWQGSELATVKMRGYERKKHFAYTLDHNNQIISIPDYDRISPAQWIHHQIAQNPEAVQFPQPFFKNEIIKTALFANLYPKRAASPIKPGDNLRKMGVPKWASLNQFTFQTKDQLNNWKKFAERLMRRYAVSLELFYLNDDSTLNYQRMIEDIHRLVSQGLGSNSLEEISHHFDKSRNRNKLIEKHPLLQNLKKTQDSMKKRLSDFYATTEHAYQSTIENSQQDLFDDLDQLDHESPK